MHKIKTSLALAALGMVGLALWAGAVVDRSGSAMSVAANRLLASLDKEQAAAIAFPFDSPERLNWHFIPRERKGLSIKAMNGAQRALAFGLLQSGLGTSGYQKATTIMSLEQILLEVEKGSGPVRDPERYFFTIFGTPSDTERWGWRVEGHHLSLNWVVEGGKVIAATPAFFGANPAEVRVGSRSGLRTLGEIEDRALRLLQALTDDQRKVAVIAEKAPADVRSANTPQPPDAPAEGIAYSQLTDAQRPMLLALIETYAEDMPTAVGEAWLAEIRKAGFDDVRFAWFGAADRSQGHAYRVQGPTFLIEFNNTQNNANHVHAFWRNMLGDFAIPRTAK
ncbi:MAG: DUF3500 domain-containing protein [Isosphaeraceae bacterium]|nr:DUF3500 domain-containing protein [Isosphaeraceae bacterium]